MGEIRVEDLFILVLLLFFAIIAGLLIYLANKFPIIGSIFRFIFKILSVLFTIFLSVLMIAAHSFLACMIILMMIFFIKEPHFFYGGDPLNPVLHTAELAKLSITYGLLYFAVNSLCIRFFSSMRFNVWLVHALVFVTTSLTVIISYPLLVRSLFPGLTTTITAAFYLVGLIFIFYLSRIFRREYYAFQRTTNPAYYVLYRLIPWLRKGKPPNDGPPIR